MSEGQPAGLDPLPGTVKLYERHLLVYTGQAAWPARVEQDGGFMQALCRTVTRHERVLPRTVKITAIDAPSVAASYDILLFPDQIKYLGVTIDQIPLFVQDHLVGDKPSRRLRWEEATGRYIFVCIHGERDERCGQCGPGLRVALAAALRRRADGIPVNVHGTSHVGGHAYAGNVIFYPEGDWYGGLTTAAIPDLVQTVLVDGAVATAHWRGRLGLSPADQVALAQEWARPGATGPVV